MDFFFLMLFIPIVISVIGVIYWMVNNEEIKRRAKDLETIFLCVHWYLLKFCLIYRLRGFILYGWRTLNLYV